MTNIPNRAREEAAEWFARRRRGVMTLQERAGYEGWSHIAENSAAMAEVDRLWRLMGELESSFVHDAELKKVQTSNLRRSALLAILCVASLGVGMVSYAGHSDFWTRLDWVER